MTFFVGTLLQTDHLPALASWVINRATEVIQKKTGELSPVSEPIFTPQPTHIEVSSIAAGLNLVCT